MPPRAMLAALIVVMCWGGNFSATKYALADLPPFVLLVLRYVGVVVLMAPFALRMPVPRLRQMLTLSLMLIVIQFALVFVAIRMGLSLTSTIIAGQLGVPFACVMAAIFFKDYLGPWRSAGLMVAFLGVVIVAGTPNAAEHWGGFLMAVGGAFAWSSANIYVKTLKGYSPVQLLFWPALCAIPIFVTLSLLFEQGQVEALQMAHWMAWAGAAYNAVLASIVGYGLWNWLIARYPMSQVMPFGLLMPVFGISAASLLFAEPMTPRIILGGILAVGGVGVIVIRRPKLAEIEP